MKPGYERTAQEGRDATNAHDNELLKRGTLIGIAEVPVRVRNPDATRVQTDSAAFVSSSLPVAAFVVIETENISEAIEMVPQSPCAVARGVVEINKLKVLPESGIASDGSV